MEDIKPGDLVGVYRELAEEIGIQAALRVHAIFRGQQITFPVSLFKPEFLAHMIVERYDGHNAKQLATEFGYSEKWIRKIIRESKQSKEESE